MTRQSTRRNTMAVSSAGVGAAPRQPEPGQAERDAAPRGRPAIPCGRPARDRHPRGPGGDGRQLPGERGDQGPRVRATLRPADRRGRLGTLRGRPRRRAGALRAASRGEEASDRDRNLLLLEKLRGQPFDRRGARFTSAVAVAREAELLFQAQESVLGCHRGPSMRERTASATTRSSSTRRWGRTSASCGEKRRTA